MIIKGLYKNQPVLQRLGFEKKDTIIHPSRISKEAIEHLGQDKPLMVTFIAKDRFRLRAVVNYRDELYLVEDGFMAGGLEVSTNIEKFVNDEFKQERCPNQIKGVKELLEKLKEESK